VELSCVIAIVLIVGVATRAILAESKRRSGMDDDALKAEDEKAKQSGDWWDA
jgi:hypothetical protein